VPLCVGAAFTFHRTRRSADASLSPIEYAQALDIAAAALSRLVPIYAAHGRAAIDLARQRFRGGAAELLGEDGSILASLSIERGDVLPALLKIERLGVEYLAPRRARPTA